MAVIKKAFTIWVPVWCIHEPVGDYRDYTYSNIGGPLWNVGLGDNFSSERKQHWQLNVNTLPEEIKNLFPLHKEKVSYSIFTKTLIFGIIQKRRNFMRFPYKLWDLRKNRKFREKLLIGKCH